jgi:hypothetical protein
MEQNILSDKKTISTEQSLEILIKELENQKDLFIHFENGIQNLFNFYLVLITASFGGVVIIAQVASSGSIVQAQYLIGNLLLLVTMIGVMYNGSLANRYAHMGRCAQALDDLRRKLLRMVDLPLPALYQPFIQGYAYEPDRLDKSFEAFYAVGTYHTYIAFINSLCFSGSIRILAGDFFSSWNIGIQLVLFIALTFILLILQVLYGRFRKRSMAERAGLAINTYRVRLPMNIDSSEE